MNLFSFQISLLLVAVRVAPVNTLVVEYNGTPLELDQSLHVLYWIKQAGKTPQSIVDAFTLKIQQTLNAECASCFRVRTKHFVLSLLKICLFITECCTTVPMHVQ